MRYTRYGAATPEQNRGLVWDAFVRQRGKRYAECRYANWQAADGTPQANAVARIRDYVERSADTMRTGKGLVLLGGCGTGKDHLMVAAMHHATGSCYFGNAGYAEWISGAAMYGRLHDAMKRQDASADVLDDLRFCDLLLLSDPCEAGQSLTKWEQSTMLELVDARYNHRRPIWVTINASSRQQMETMLGAAIVDRLVDGATIIACNWSSYRKPDAAV